MRTCFRVSIIKHSLAKEMTNHAACFLRSLRVQQGNYESISIVVLLFHFKTIVHGILFDLFAYQILKYKCFATLTQYVMPVGCHHAMHVGFRQVMSVGCHRVIHVGCHYVMPVGCHYVIHVRCHHVMPVGCHHVIHVRCHHVMPVGCHHVIHVGCHHVMPVGCQNKS